MNTDQLFVIIANKKVATASQEFITPYLISMFAFIFFDSTRNIFNAYQKFDIPNNILSINYVKLRKIFFQILHFVWLYFLVTRWGYGMFGIGLARSITEFLNMICLFAVLKIGKFFEELHLLWTKKAFTHWIGYIKYSLPMGSVLYLDWIASDLQTLFVSMNGEKH